MKAVYYVAMSLDGRIADADGGVGWLEGGEHGSEDYGYHAFYDEVDAIVMGKATYEQILSFGDWPYPGKECVVCTSRALPADTNVRFASDAVAATRALKEKTGRIMWVVGGGRLAGSLLDAGLIDELVVTIVPRVLGSGTPLFDGGTASAQITALKHYPNGFVQLTTSLRNP